jgi:hypothetical protein
MSGWMVNDIINSNFRMGFTILTSMKGIYSST